MNYYCLQLIKQTDFYSSVNDTLYDDKGKDQFRHEQNLVIFENQTALIMGCGHAGVINIMEEAKKSIAPICVWEVIIYSILLQRKRYRRNC